MFHAGVGRHIFCLTPENISELLKWSVWARIVEVIALAFVKISVCLLVLRLIDQTSKGIARFLKLLMISIVICHIVPLLLYALQCRPLQAVWNPQVQGECYSGGLTYTASYVVIGKKLLHNCCYKLANARESSRRLYGFSLCFHPRCHYLQATDENFNESGHMHPYGPWRLVRSY